MRVILLSLSAAIFVTISYEAMPIGLLTDIATQLHTDTAGGGLLVSSYALVVVVGSIPLSAAVARYDARVVLLAMLVVFAFSSALVAASTTLAVAVAARLLGGAAHAIIFTAVFRIAWPSSRGSAAGGPQAPSRRATRSRSRWVCPPPPHWARPRAGGSRSGSPRPRSCSSPPWPRSSCPHASRRRSRTRPRR